jgi:hypothetical protein
MPIFLSMGDINREIVVIGNGPSILNHNFGKLIDSFANVVRINDYQITGYDKFIGTKTNIWARSNSKKTKDRNWSAYDKVILASPEWNFGSIEKIAQGHKNVIIVPKEQALQLQRTLKQPGRARVGDKRWPSTGLLVLDYLIKEYKIVYLHGFDCFKKIKGSPRHYYNNKERIKRCFAHDQSKELGWIESNVRQGKLKFLKDIKL